MATLDAIDIPLSLVKPVKLTRNSSAHACCLLFPYRTSPQLALAVNWDGENHLIHLDGSKMYSESAIEIGVRVRGVIISEFEFRVDVTSRYNSLEKSDPSGSLIIKDSELFLTCMQLGDPFYEDSHLVPLRKGYGIDAVEETCGFTRWSIAIQDDGKSKVVRSFEALAEK